MRTYFTLLGREFGGYLGSLSGYVVMASVLLLLGISLVDMMVKLNGTRTGIPITEMFFGTYYFWWILLLTAPVITMRTFALEKFSGTFETLMTAPVSDRQVVLAKFSGAWLFYAMTWLPLLACMAVIRAVAQEPTLLNWPTVGTSFVGIGLIGALYMSLGCFASSLTRNQVVAAMNSFVMGLTLFLFSLRSMGAESPAGWQDRVFAYISMQEHMGDFVLGIVDTRHLAFYLSFTALFLYLTLKVVESRRWK